MSEVVLDENGNEIDQDGNQKNKMNADYMGKADIVAIINEFKSNFTLTASLLNKAAYGSGYSEASDALSKLVGVVAGGAHVEFAKKNSWISNPAQKSAYLTSGAGAGIADKQLICDFYTLVNASADFRTSFIKLINTALDRIMFKSYQAVRFEIQMRDMFSQSELNGITSAFAEFDAVYNKYNDGGIYDSVLLNVRKGLHTPEENLELVLDCLDAAISSKDHLSHFIMSSGKTAPSGMNQLYILDRETKLFHDFGDDIGSMQHMCDSCSEVSGQLMGLYALAGDELLTYLDGYRQVLEALMVVFENGAAAVDNFLTKKDTAPYSMMHYSALVKNCTEKHMLGTLTDPLEKGTNYGEMARKMLDRFKNLAQTVAKYAPQ